MGMEEEGGRGPICDVFLIQPSNQKEKDKNHKNHKENKATHDLARL